MASVAVTDKVTADPTQTDCEAGCVVMTANALFIEITAVLLLLITLLQFLPVTPEVSRVIVMVVAPAVFRLLVLKDPEPGVLTVMVTVLLFAVLGALKLYVTV